jgi:hypothetical protein
MRNILESKRLTQISKAQLRMYLRDINRIHNANPDRPGADHDSPSSLEVFKWFVAKEKAIYAQLNQMKQGKNTYIGYMWAPSM